MASSWTLRQSPRGDGDPGFKVVVGERRFGWYRDDSEDRSAAVGARRTIFLDCRLVRGTEGSPKGGLRIPSLGVIINF